MKRVHWHFTLAGTIVLLGLILVGLEPYSSEFLAYRRTNILHGEIWRLFTCNFHHTNLNHLLLNGGGLLVITQLHQCHYKKYTPLILLSIIGILMSVTLLLTDPKLQGYLGLSGVLHGLFAWGVIADIKQGEKTGYLLLIGLVIKLGWEQLVGPSASTEALIGAKVLTTSHLYGAIWGAVLALLQPKLKF